MSSPGPWSTEVVLELTSPENVPETGMQVEIECETETVVEQENSSEIVYCHCRRPWTKEFMIMCEHCGDWFHGICVGINESEALDIDKYHCSNCEGIVGKTIYKSADETAIVAGSEVFIARLKERVFVSAEDIICRERGHNINFPSLFLKGFNRPILVDEVDGLGIKLPPDSITVHDVERFVGPAMQVEVIQVENQSSIPMTLRQFIEYFTSANRNRRLNLISLEVSDTSLGQLIEPPYIARKLDWVLNNWPKELNEELFERPKVSKYCLIGSKDSYTDFHIDFGGTSVWYHVLWGEKVFYLIEPTDINIALYEKWMSSSPKDKYEAFFADTVDYCYKLVLKKGQTLFIPTGWIHAVLTTMDSLVFGGNFLHMLNMEMQLRIYNMEKKLNIKRRYMFPSFELVHWLASQDVIHHLTLCNDQGVFPAQLRVGTKALIQNLEIWYQGQKKNGGIELLPSFINPHSTIKRLLRELKAAEKRHATTMGKTTPSGRVNAASSITAEFLNQEPNMTSFSGFLLDDYGKSKRSLMSSSSLDEMSSVPSPTESNPPIKLKLKKRNRHRRGSWSTEDSKSPDGNLFGDEGHGAGGLIIGSSNDASQSSPKEGPLKIRLSLGEARMELVGIGSPAMYSSKSQELNTESDTDGESSIFSTEDAKKSKSHRSSHHHKKKHRSRHRKHHANGDGPHDTNDGGKGILNGKDPMFGSIEKEDGYHSPTQFRLSCVGDDGLLDQPKSDKRRHKKHKRRRHDSSEEDIKKVHQDDQYIYPSLTVSDDEDANGKKRSRTAQEVDEAWSPGGRMSKLVPKAQQRPSRAGAKRKAVEKGLLDAANSLPENDALKSKRKYKQRSQKLESTNGASGGVVAGTSKGMAAATAGDVVRKKKMPKGMATVKQRLSKILKLKRISKF